MVVALRGDLLECSDAAAKQYVLYLNEINAIGK